MRWLLPIVMLSACDPCPRRPGAVRGLDLLVQSEYLRTQLRHAPADTVVVWAEADASCLAAGGVADQGVTVPFPLLPHPEIPERFGGWYIWRQMPISARFEFRDGSSTCFGAGECAPLPSPLDLEPAGAWIDSWTWYREIWFPMHPDTGGNDLIEWMPLDGHDRVP